MNQYDVWMEMTAGSPIGPKQWRGEARLGMHLSLPFVPAVGMSIVPNADMDEDEGYSVRRVTWHHGESRFYLEMGAVVVEDWLRFAISEIEERGWVLIMDGWDNEADALACVRHVDPGHYKELITCNDGRTYLLRAEDVALLEHDKQTQSSIVSRRSIEIIDAPTS